MVQEERRKKKEANRRINRILQEKRDAGLVKSVGFSIEPETFDAIQLIKKITNRSYADIFRDVVKDYERENGKLMINTSKNNLKEHKK